MREMLISDMKMFALTKLPPRQTGIRRARSLDSDAEDGDSDDGDDAWRESGAYGSIERHINIAYHAETGMRQFTGKEPQQQALDYIREQGSVYLKVRSLEIEPYLKGGKWRQGTRSFFVCSELAYASMVRTTPPTERHFYEMVQFDKPINLYMDCDKRHREYEQFYTEKDVKHALVEAYECIAEATRIEGWDFDPAEILLSTTVADYGEKQSRHVVLHMPGNRMLACYEDAKWLITRALEISRRRHAYDPYTEQNAVSTVTLSDGSVLVDDLSLEDALALKSPIYFRSWTSDGLTGGKRVIVESMVDTSVYTKNRNMRSVWNSKAHKAGEAPKTPLVPVCTCTRVHARPGAKCVHQEFGGTQADLLLFLSHSITFQPLDARTGLPVDLTLLRVAPPPELVSPKPTGTGAQKPRVDRDGPHVRSVYNAVASAAASKSVEAAERERVDRLAETDGGRIFMGYVEDVHRNRLARLVADALGVRCTVTKVLGDTGTTFWVACENYKSCPYKGSDHRHNHVFITVVVRYPRVWFFKSCASPHCASFKRNAELQIAPEKYMPILEDIMASATVTLDFPMPHSVTISNNNNNNNHNDEDSDDHQDQNDGAESSGQDDT